MQLLQTWISVVNEYLWGYVLIYLLLFVGIFFSVRLNWTQWRAFPHVLQLLKLSCQQAKPDRASVGISAFQALCTSLAARVGTGNLAGVAVALKAGGPGALFWMWIVAVFGMATAFAESTLAQFYKQKNKQGQFFGGPAFYMTYGLGARWAGKLFALLLVCTFGFIFNSVQSNSISQAFTTAFGWSPCTVGIGLAGLSAIVISGGLRKTAALTTWFVPLMAFTYLGFASWIVLSHWERLPSVLALVLREATGWRALGSGYLGYTVSQAMMNGIKRGLFSNEAGMGSSPNAAAAAVPVPNHPVSQGYLQILGVVLDTFVICTATALIVLTSGALEGSSGLDGIALTQKTFALEVGQLGPVYVAIASFLFSFTAMLSNCAYAELNLQFLCQNAEPLIRWFRCMVLAMIAFGAMSALPLVWGLADLFMGAMTCMNLVALLLLSNQVVALYEDYHQQRDDGVLPTFSAKRLASFSPRVVFKIWP